MSSDAFASVLKGPRKSYLLEIPGSDANMANLNKHVPEGEIHAYLCHDSIVLSTVE